MRVFSISMNEQSKFKGTNALIFRWFLKEFSSYREIELRLIIRLVGSCVSTTSPFCKWTKQPNDISARFIAILFVSEMLWYRKIRYLIYYAVRLQIEVRNQYSETLFKYFIVPYYLYNYELNT